MTPAGSAAGPPVRRPLPSSASPRVASCSPVESSRPKVGRYLVEEQIGRGMMGVVWRAVDPELSRTVALKTVHLAFAVSPEERIGYEKRFLAEARAAARLSHPGIVVVHDVGRDEDDGTLYIALEYLQGRTLAEISAGGSPMGWRDALRLTARVAEALEHAHAAGVVHRDIKPANIMVLDSGQPKIMDFGIAKMRTEQLTTVGQFLGTPAYMSPEQASSQAVDGRSDIFSLGAVLYRLLTGRSAFEADSVPAILNRILFREPPPPSTLIEGLPRSVDGVVARALAKRPEDRYASAQAFARELEGILSGREPTGPTERPPDVEGTRVSRALPSPAQALASAGAARVGKAAAVGWVLGRRRRFVLGASGVGVALLILLWRLLGTASAAHVEVNFEHSLRNGVLKVFVDDGLVLEESLEGRQEDMIVVKVWRGRLRKSFDVRPGNRKVRLEVVGESFNGTQRIDGRLERGETRRLEVRLGGLLRKELTAWWGPRPEAPDADR